MQKKWKKQISYGPPVRREKWKKMDFFEENPFFYHATPYGGPTEIEMEKKRISSRKIHFFHPAITL